MHCQLQDRRIKNWHQFFFTIVNCEIVRSHSLTHRINYQFMCLSAYWQQIISQWAREKIYSYCKINTWYWWLLYNKLFSLTGYTHLMNILRRSLLTRDPWVGLLPRPTPPTRSTKSINGTRDRKSCVNELTNRNLCNKCRACFFCTVYPAD